MDKVLRIGLWCAVSSKQQADDDKASLPHQEQLGHEFAEQVGGQVAAVYSVPGHTRSIVFYEQAAEAMPAYADLRSDAEAGKLDVLHYYSVDRLGRTTALAQTVLDMLEANGVIAHQAGTPFTVERSEGEAFVHAIQSVNAAQEIARLKARHRMGMANRIRRGLMPGSPPFGYSPIRDATGQVVGAELNGDAETVREATRLFLKGIAIEGIVRELTEAGYPCPCSCWQRATIWRWMQNDTYAGIVRWGPFVADAPSAAFEALWDQETYRAVLREREGRAVLRLQRKRGSVFLDVAFCRRCGSRMTKRTMRYPSGRETVTLRCGAHTARRVTGVACHANQIPMRDVRAAVVKELAQLVDVDALQERLAEPQQSESERKAERIEQRLAVLSEERTRLARAYTAGVMPFEIYAQEEQARADEVAQLEAHQATLVRDLARLPPDARFALVEDVRALIDAGWDAVPVTVLNHALRAIGMRVWCEEREVVQITYV